MHTYPLKFKPIQQERIWGGSKLKGLFQVETDKPIGEYWVLSGHPSATSIAQNGAYAGKSLNEIIAADPHAYLGKSPQDRFPLLIKFLEAEEDLSVQIHPDNAYGLEHEGDYGKTEAWYILDAKQGGQMIYGHSFVNKEGFYQSVQEQNIQAYINKRDIQTGEIVFLPTQTIHALLAGTIVLEIQQTSDVTYRVYDWNRVDASGKRRELHVDKAANVIVYGETDGAKHEQGDTRRYILQETREAKHEHLVSCPYFTIEKANVRGGSYELQLGKSGNPDILIAIEGEGTLEWTVDGAAGSLVLKVGDTVLMPSTIVSYRITSANGIKFIRTYY